MAATITLRVKLNRFPQMSPRMRAAVGRRIHAAGFRVEGDAKGRAPVRTGMLRDRIRNQPSGPISTVIGVGVEYGIYVERGTRKMAAQPFLEPAMQAEAPRLEASFRGIEGEL